MKANKDTCFIFFSLDNSRTLGIKRILSQIGKKSYMKPGHETMSIAQDDKDIIKKLFPHIYIIEKGKTPTDIRRSIQATKTKGNYKHIIACIDYIQLVNGTDDQYNNADKRNILNDNLKEIKLIQIESNSFFMVLSQLSRSKQGTYSYRETSEIENVSDVCIDFMYTSDTDEAKATNERVLKISKNKLGVKGQKYSTTVNECFMFSKVKTKDKQVATQGNRESNNILEMGK